MSVLSDLKDFLKANPKAKTPYWPGARYTNRVDIRTSQDAINLGGSPLHPGVDRAGGREFTGPYDGEARGKMLPGSDIGSLLRILPEGAPFELHVFHTEWQSDDEEFSCEIFRGGEMPVKSGKLGLSLGVHLHTDTVFPFDEELLEWLRPGADIILRKDDKLSAQYIIAHCRRHGLRRSQVVAKAAAQIEAWGITEMTRRYMVRQWIGGNRLPAWGQGPVILVDSKWLLDI